MGCRRVSPPPAPRHVRRPGRRQVASAPTVTAAPTGGAYAVSQSVTLSAGEPATIFFTIDGSDPTTSSPQYAVPISISASLTLKFVAVDAAGNRSPVVSASYVIQNASRKAIYGSGSNRPLNATDRAYFELYFFNPLHPRGLIFYSYHGRAGSARGSRKLAVDFVGTEVTSVSVRGNTPSSAAWEARFPISAAPLPPRYRWCSRCFRHDHSRPPGKLHLFSESHPPQRGPARTPTVRRGCRHGGAKGGVGLFGTRFAILAGHCREALRGSCSELMR